ncbi:MAG: glycosyltransferase family 39 protein, partial [Anaerolineae bacterium]|nr:glycosyltransferase family 39 protein [Anaerolineae bacterium]
MPDSLYWLQNTLRALPAFLLVYGVVGVPAALLLLPRRDWSQRALVLCLAFIAGPALLTLLMFALGTAGGALQMPLLRPPLLLAGLAGLTLLLLALLWRKIRRTKAPPPPAVPAVPLAVDEKLLLALLTVAVLIRLVTTAYWPFTMYDTLWVYGFQGRLYTLTGFIPPEIGYYPQFLSLQYAYGQIMLGGIDDRAARMAVPFLHIGSLLAAYVLGARLVNRRTGIVLAALWGLYPHVSAWAHQGDLEIPLAFLFTTAAALFLMAWQAGPEAPRRQYALLAGLVFGVALWTKPTAGAFAWGVMLLVALDLAGALWRGTWAAFRRHFETACLTALACLPIGGLWYLRNVLLGHAAVDFPHASWLTRATRSGDLFGWLLLAAALLLLALLWRCWQARHFGGRAGIALAGAG